MSRLTMRFKHAEEVAAKEREVVFSRFPLVFALLVTFGVASLFYGLEKAFDRIPFLADNPLVPLVVGVLILGLTGSLYRKLQ